MPRLVTATELVTRIKTATQLPSNASSKFVSDSEIKTMIRESYAELYDLLVAARGVEFYRVTREVVVPAGTQRYALDSANCPDFYQLLEAIVACRATITEQVVEDGIWFVVTDPSDWVTLRPYQVHETASLINTSYSTPDCMRYRLGGAQYAGNGTEPCPYIELLPAPTANVALRLIYLPISSVETDAESPGSETLDGVNGYEEFIVCDCAARILSIEESDASYWVGRREQIRARIAALAGQRNAGHPERVVDRRGQRIRDAGPLGGDDIWAGPWGWGS